MEFMAGMAYVGGCWLLWTVLSWAFKAECRLDRLEGDVKELTRRIGGKS